MKGNSSKAKILFINSKFFIRNCNLIYLFIMGNIFGKPAENQGEKKLDDKQKI